MKFGKIVLVVAAIFCFGELARVPWHGSLTNIFEPSGMDPDPSTIAIWGILLAGRALSAKDPPIPVVVSGCSAAAVLIAESHRMVTVKNTIMIPLALAAAICFIFWEQIEKVRKRKEEPRSPQV